jgi:hypothetical protein
MPIYDLFKVEKLPGLLVGITIHGGDSVSRDGLRWRVPKRDLVSAAVIQFQNGALSIAAALPEAATLRSELETFRMKIDARTGHDSYEAWREGQHDDLVLALSLAVWFGENRGKPARQVPFEGI